MLKPEPWEEVSQGNYLLKFSWDPNKDPVVVVDSEGTHITDENTPLFGGSRVKLAFYQKPYVLKDGVTYGTRLVLQGVQVISAGSSAGVDAGTASQEDVASLFGKTEGFKVGEPNIITDILRVCCLGMTTSKFRSGLGELGSLISSPTWGSFMNTNLSG